MKNSKYNKAFTMAEAILVMTILGIIATIMISTLKPAEFKEKGLKTLAKNVFSEIDSTMTQILVNDTKSNNLNSLNKFTVGKSKSMKNYFGKEDPFLIVDIDARSTIKEITSKTSKNDAHYKILIDIYNEMFGDCYE